MSTYQDHCNKLSQEAFKELSKKHPDVIKRLKDIPGYLLSSDNSPQLEVRVQEDTKWGCKQNTSVKFSLSVVDPKKEPGTLGYLLLHQLSFTLDYYPACCAIKTMNNFQYRDGIFTQEFINDFINMCISAYAKGFYVEIRRIIANFVETSRNNVFNMDSNIPDDPAAKIQYPMIYEWAKSQRAMQKMLYVNHNTERIIHTTQILLGAKDE
jgi:hypothetical protein